VTLERERAQRGGDQAGGAFLPPMCAPRVPYGGDSEAVPERVMNDLKTYASRRWAGHGSTLYLWKAKDVDTAVRCVVYEQGEPMSVFDGTRELNPSEG